MTPAFGGAYKGRRVLVTDGRNPFGQAMARTLEAAGAQVFLGIADAWKPFPGQDRLEGGLTQADGIQLARWLGEAGIAVLNVSSGLGGWRRGRATTAACSSPTSR